MNTLRSAAGTLLLATAIPASAATLTYDFSVTAHSGPLAGVTSFGSFSFDDSLVPADGTDHYGVALLSTLSFSWNGTDYTAATANTGEIQRDSAGNFQVLAFGNFCPPGSSCSVSSFTDQWFFDFNVNNHIAPASFDYAVPQSIYTYPDGTVTLSQVQSSVPEPGMVGLLIVGAAGLAFFGRRCRFGRCRRDV